jgi:phage shock protein A
MAHSLLKRIATLLEINLDDLLMGAADPHDAAAPIIADMERGLAQARDAVASAVVKERQLERQLVEASALNEEWDAKTDAALQAGDEDLARSALKHKLSYQQRAEALQAELDRHRQALAEMKAGLSALQAKVKETRLKSRPV